MGRPIVHFEIPVTDSERISKFYSDLFDWKFEKQPMGDMDYWMIETTGRGPGHLAGGMYMKQGNETDRPRFYVGVEDIDSHTRRLTEAGGTVLVEKQEIPGFGLAVIGTDPEGNVLGLFQPLQPTPQAARPQRATRSTSTHKARKKVAPKSSKKRKK